jgi:hypothetical protein
MAKLKKQRGGRNCGQLLLCVTLMLVPLFSSCGPNEVAKPLSDVAKPEMRRVPVISTNLHSVGYDASSQLLTIEFRNGSIYEYERVPLKVHADLMKAKSHGKYFHGSIRNAGFPSQRIH